MKIAPLLWALAGAPFILSAADDVFAPPAEAPRTWFLPGQASAFRQFALEGAGAEAYARIKADFDTYHLHAEVPAEPATYGDPDPRARTPEKVVLWRGAQDAANYLATVAEAATMLWLIEGEDKYLETAQRFLLGGIRWSQDGVSDIYYNDEAHFRLWRKLPAVYDHLRDTFTEAERVEIIASLAERGRRNHAWILESRTHELSRNSIEVSPRSHPVRFMSSTGIGGLALYDDTPEARDWYAFAYTWYRDVFTPWGGDDGGWAEGTAYWRGVYEHAVFQDALMLLGDPMAYQNPFWKNTGYFPVYFVQPYFATGFGDFSNAGRFNMEPGVKHFVDHLARVTGNGAFRAWASQYTDRRPLPHLAGLERIYRVYPNATEYLVRDFLADTLPEPEEVSLATLPRARFFADIGWVAMHSHLGEPDKDIHVMFKSSPYGSFSHSHGDQNTFIINAYGRNLAINAGYREYHRSKLHKYFTRQTISKNNVLLDLRGQEVQDKRATGEIIRFEEHPRAVWTTGEAASAYQLLQPRVAVESVQRDLLFIDHRYVLVRDRVVTDKPVMASYLLHAMEPMQLDEGQGEILIHEDGAFLDVRVAAVENSLTFSHRTGFPVPVDPTYVDPVGVARRSWLTAPNKDQAHFRADTSTYASDITLWSVLWPTLDVDEVRQTQLIVDDAHTVKIMRPDGQTDYVRIDGGTLTISSD